MRLSRTQIYLLVCLVLVLCAAATVTYLIRDKAVDVERDQATEALFSPEAQQAFTTVDGAAVDITSVQGAVVVATTWASWCPQCAGELILLNQAVADRSDTRIKVLALNRNEPKHQAQRFISTLPELPNITFVLDNQDHFFDVIAGYAMPETVFYNEAGEIVLHKRGNLTRDEIVAALDAALVAQ